MGRRSERTFFQRRHTDDQDDQQVNEKILYIINQENAYQTTMKGNPCAWLADVNWFSLNGKQFGSSSKN